LVKKWTKENKQRQPSRQNASIAFVRVSDQTYALDEQTGKHPMEVSDNTRRIKKQQTNCQEDDRG
jgi:competence protein ComGC